MCQTRPAHSSDPSLIFSQQACRGQDHGDRFFREVLGGQDQGRWQGDFILSARAAVPFSARRSTLLTSPLAYGKSQVGKLGDNIKVQREKTKVTVTADIAMSKRYLKYLTKKYLKKHNVRDWCGDRGLLQHDSHGYGHVERFQVT
jgi:hypothetical protein